MHQHLTELNFLDNTLIGANESRNVSETSDSDQSFSSASTEKNINWINKRFLRKQLKRKCKKKKMKGSYQKNKKLEHQEQKFQEKLLEIMEYQDKMFNQTMCKT